MAYLNEQMWTQLFVDNRENLCREIAGLIERLEQFRAAISQPDPDAFAPCCARAGIHQNADRERGDRTMTTVHVHASRDYDVCIGAGCLDSLGRRAAAVKAPCSALLVSDETVYALYGAAAEASLTRAGFSVRSFTFAPGEESKTVATLARILDALAAVPCTRSDLVVALGGGVAGDMAGFAAAVYLRGIEFIQVPTTLLAAVDASVGGKTAVNLSAGKNLAGAFWQPSLVLCDCDVFQTLPAPVFADGMAEAVKAGMIADAQLLDMLEDGAQPLPALVARCVQIKRGLVAADERDVGDRQLLNFGHTAAHAIERATDFQVSHGSAVAIGMVMMARPPGDWAFQRRTARRGWPRCCRSWVCRRGRTCPPPFSPKPPCATRSAAARR